MKRVGGGGGVLQIVENLVGPSFLCLHPETSDVWNFRHRKLPGHLQRYMPEIWRRGGEEQNVIGK